MLPKGLYELLPYIYLTSGGWLLLSQGGAALLLGTVLYLYGGWVWIIRSANRRRSAAVRRRQTVGPHWNHWTYELLPFLYGLAGIYMLGLTGNSLNLLAGSLLIFTGVVLMAVRASARRRITPPPAERAMDPVDRMQAIAEQQRSVLTQSPFFSEPAKASAAMPALKLVVDNDHPGDAEDRHDAAHTWRKCGQCSISDICDSVILKRESVSEIMRLSQTVDPQHAFELYRDVVSRFEGRALSEAELMPMLDKLHDHANLCQTWRRTGRLA